MRSGLWATVGLALFWGGVACGPSGGDGPADDGGSTSDVSQADADEGEADGGEDPQPDVPEDPADVPADEGDAPGPDDDAEGTADADASPVGDADAAPPEADADVAPPDSGPTGECDNNDDCPVGDDLCGYSWICIDHACVAEGAPAVCEGVAAGPCEVVSCVPETGECGTAPVPDGQACDPKGDPCIGVGSLCAAGACLVVPPDGLDELLEDFDAVADGGLPSGWIATKTPDSVSGWYTIDDGELGDSPALRVGVQGAIPASYWGGPSDTTVRFPLELPAGTAAAALEMTVLADLAESGVDKDLLVITVDDVVVSHLGSSVGPVLWSFPIPVAGPLDEPQTVEVAMRFVTFDGQDNLAGGIWLDLFHLRTTVASCETCQIAGECDDGDPCTDDSCAGGVCENLPIGCQGPGGCISSVCDAGYCLANDTPCDDGDPCTVGICVDESCSYGAVPLVTEDHVTGFEPADVQAAVTAKPGGFSWTPVPMLDAPEGDFVLYAGDPAADPPGYGGAVTDVTAVVAVTPPEGADVAQLAFDLALDVADITTSDAAVEVRVNGATALLIGGAGPAGFVTHRVPLVGFAGVAVPVSFRFFADGGDEPVPGGAWLDALRLELPGPAECVAGECAIAATCDDGDPCTIETCTEGACDHVDAVCDDGDPCTFDLCHSGACLTEPILCEDGDPCTIDACDGGDCVVTGTAADATLVTDFSGETPLAGWAFTNAPGSATWALAEAALLEAPLSDLEGTVLWAPRDAGFLGEPTDATATLTVDVPEGAGAPALAIELAASLVDDILVGDRLEVQVDGEPALQYGAGGLATIWVGLGEDSAGASVEVALRFRAVESALLAHGVAIASITLHTVAPACAATGCLYDGACDDGDPCTVDACADGTCATAPVDCAPGFACSDASCVGGGYCDATALVCDDGDPCTEDTCTDEATCVATYAPPVLSFTVADFSGGTLGPVQIGSSSPDGVWTTGDPAAGGGLLAGGADMPAGSFVDTTAFVDVTVPEGVGATDLVLSLSLQLGTLGPSQFGVPGLEVRVDGEVGAVLHAATPGFVELAAPLPGPGTWPVEIRFLSNGETGAVGPAVHLAAVEIRFADTSCEPEDGQCALNAHCDDGDPCTASLCLDGACALGADPCAVTGVCASSGCSDDGTCFFALSSCDDDDPCTLDSCEADGCLFEPFDGIQSVWLVGFHSGLPAGWTVLGDAPVLDVDADLGALGVSAGDGEAVDTSVVFEVTPPGGAALGAELRVDVEALTGDASVSVAVGTQPPVATTEPGTIAAGVALSEPTSAVVVRVIGDGPLEVAIGEVGLYQASFACGEGCTGPAHCDDGDSCTADSCVEGTCDHTGKACDDGEPCTLDACEGGNCTFLYVDCSDGDLCTVDTCDGEGGCDHLYDGALAETPVADFDAGMPPSALATVVPPSPPWVVSDGALVLDGAASPVPGYLDATLELAVSPDGDPGGAAELALQAVADLGDDGPGAAGLEIYLDGELARVVGAGEGEVTVPIAPDATQTVGFRAFASGEGEAFAHFTLDDVVVRTSGPGCEPCVIDAQCPGGTPCSPAACEAGACGLEAGSGCDDGDPCTLDVCGEAGCVSYPEACDDADPCTVDGCGPEGCVHTPIAADPLGESVAAAFDGSDPFLALSGEPGGLTWTLSEGELVLGDDEGAPTATYAAGGPTMTTASLLVEVPSAAEAALRVDLRLGLDPASGYGDALTIEVDGEVLWASQASLGDGETLQTVEVGVPPGTFADVVFRFVSDGVADDGPGPAVAEARLVTLDGTCAAAGCATAGACDDADPCTLDTCDLDTGECVHAAVACDDGDACTDDACTDALCGATETVCDDGNPCTTEACVAGICEVTPAAEPVEATLDALDADPGEAWTLAAGEASEVTPAWDGEGALHCPLAGDGLYVDCWLETTLTLPPGASGELLLDVSLDVPDDDAVRDRAEVWVDGALRALLGASTDGVETVAVPLAGDALGGDVALAIRFTTHDASANTGDGFALHGLAVRTVAEACEAGCLLDADCFESVCSSGTCADGTCVPAPPPACDDGDGCTDDACSTDLGCVAAPAACDDGDPCSTDGCADGACTAAFTGGLTVLPAVADFEAGVDDGVTLEGDLVRTPYTAASGVWGVETGTGGTVSFTATDPGGLEPLAARAWVSLPTASFATLTVDGVVRAVLDGPTEGFEVVDGLVEPGGGTIDVALTLDGPGALDALGLVGTTAGLDCGASCGWAGPCLDADPCTVDACVSGICPHAPATCDDADPCTEDLCGPEGCAHPPLDCDDEDPCTVDTCDGGACAHAPHDGVDPVPLYDFEGELVPAALTLDAAVGGWGWQLDDEQAHGGTGALYAGDATQEPNTYDGADTDATASFALDVPDGVLAAELRLWLMLDVEDATSTEDVFELWIDEELTVWWGQTTDGFERLSVDVSDHAGTTVIVGLRFVTGGAEANAGGGAWVDDVALHVRTAFCGVGCALDLDCAEDSSFGCALGRCEAGTCEAAAPLVCDDGDPCHLPSCEAGAGCAFPPKCADDNPCTDVSCDAGTCLFDPVPCDDDDACTTDVCDPAIGCDAIEGACAPEDCSNGSDDNGNGLADCLDPQCHGEVGCACEPLDVLGCGDALVASTAGAGSTDALTFHFCGAGFSGPWPERSWQIAAAPAGLHPVVRATGLQAGLFAASYPDGVCDELCSTAAGAPVGETFFLPLPEGEETLLVLEGLEAPTSFDLEILCVPAAEASCGDQLDDDLDGLFDCDDPDCAPDPVCVPEGPCATAAPIACGESVALSASGGSTTYELAEGCPGAPPFLPGPELALPFVAPTTGFVTATVSGGPTLLVLADGEDGCDTGACLGIGDGAVTFWAVAGHTYQLLVDTGFDAPTDFELEVDCAPPATEPSCTDCVDGDGDGPVDCDDPDCAASAACGPGCRAEGAIGCGSLVAASTGGADTNVDAWPCPGGVVDLPGGERAWRFVATGSGPVTAHVDAASGRDVVVVRDQDGACHPGFCLAGGGADATFQAEAGVTYLIVVDGVDAAATDFQLTLSCPASMEQHCDDGGDNDGDGLVDCDDADCGPSCFATGVELACDDEVDDDGDGLVDCADGDCGCAFEPAICP